MPGPSSIVTYNLASGGDINAALANMRAGDILSLASGGVYTFAADVSGFENIPSGIASTHTQVHGNGATISGGDYGAIIQSKSYIDFQDCNFGQSKLWNMIITQSDHITCTDCDFYNPSTNSSFDCWRADNANYITLTRCNAHSTTNFDGTRNHDGFELWGPCAHFVFTDCMAYDIKNGVGTNEGHGFEVYGQVVGEICDDVQFVNCEAYNTQVGFSCEGGPSSIAHTNVVCDGCSSHDNAFYGYEGVDGATLYRQNLTGTDNTDNAISETFGSVTDL